VTLSLAREWFTAAEIAELCLIDLPATKRGVQELINRLGWQRHPDRARRRTGQGGGWEYHWQLFPMRAQRQLLMDARPEKADRRPDRDAAWAWYEGLSEKPKAAARERLAVIDRVEALVAGGESKLLAVSSIARISDVSPRSIWNWFEAIEGVRRDDRLPYLAPRHQAKVRAPRRAEIDPEFFAFLKSDYLRPAAPSFSSCYRRAARAAAKNGWQVAPERTVRRRLDAEVSATTVVLARKGADALKRLYPPQQRDKTALRPLEAVNADFHKFDVFVRFPAEGGESAPYVGRPQMVAFQDIFSGRLLAWRIDREPSALAVQLAAGDLVEHWGIPDHVLLDNGREFAAKSITGRAPTRYRFKVREDDLPGLFVSLGCTIHWATPYAGQSKPIERAFRDLCDAVAKDPRFDGAYTGNRPDAKPEDYGSRAIDLETFLTVLAEGIEEHNTRQGRRSEVAWGRSFAEVFDEAYAAGPIRRATEAQRRLWLLGAEGIRADAKTGAVWLQGNEYWDSWMTQVAGERVIVRFDPADLWGGLHVYSQSNAYLGHAPVRQKAGFFDMSEARAHAKARRNWMNAERRALEAHRTMKAADIGRIMDGSAPPARAPVDAKVVRAAFGTGRGKPVAKSAHGPTAADVAKTQAAIVADLAARRSKVTEAEESPRTRFRRAIEIERALATDAGATVEQQRWLSVYQTTPEYRAERLLFDDFGDAIFG
jgi:hypothetical protein